MERCRSRSGLTTGTDLGLGWLAETLGRDAEADAMYRRAAATNARLGARSWLAQARVDHARMLSGREGRAFPAAGRRRSGGRHLGGADPLPGSLAQEGGLGLGNQVGAARLTELLGQAGFGSVRVATSTPLNLVVEAR